MRKIINMNQGWVFTGPGGTKEQVDIPHTWNGIDGQDGGNDYFRGTCEYNHTFSMPSITESQQVYIQFRGVNASATVELNGRTICSHDNGYATFRANITPYLKNENVLKVLVDNSRNEKVYPQKADFTFYGGIYRDVELIIISKQHFDMDYYGGNGLKISSTVEGKAANVNIEAYTNDVNCRVETTIFNAEGMKVDVGYGKSAQISIPDVRLWDGLDDPYMYTAIARMYADEEKVDELTVDFGVREFHIDPDKGFFLNGKSYPLRGVSRHQDWKGLGNAISRHEHDVDMELIKEIGANSVRLAHYQHDQYFYDLCDRNGIIVWAEIPYISSHMMSGRENTINQMKELIVQNHHHPSIVTWGLSNEITIATKDKKDMLDNHHVLNDLCHGMDGIRPTSLACYAVCSPFNKVAHISDIVSWNLYLGWYVPGLFLNDLWMKFFHKIYPKRSLGFAEYGAEGMPNLHSSRPRRGDHTEEYQAKYHEYMLECFDRHPFLWSTYVWNMFDFAADARDQGGEPGMNHKGLVTFDRKIKKDSFYLYKAYWSKEPFVHICGSRYIDRTEKVTEVKVYSNLNEVKVFNNGQLVGTRKGAKIFKFRVQLEVENNIVAVAESCQDHSIVKHVKKSNPTYRLQGKSNNSANWV